MVLYTIVPPEELLEGFEEDERQFLTVRREGLLMQVEPEQQGVARVVRLLSAEPTDYLDPRWQPGSLVQLTPTDLADQ